MLACDRSNQGIHIGLYVRHDDPQKLRDTIREHMERTFYIRVPVTGVFSKQSIARGETSAFVDDIDYTDDPRIAEVARRTSYITRTKGDILNDQHTFHIFVRLANDEKGGWPLALRATDGNLKTIDGEGNEIFLKDFFTRVFAKEVTLGSPPSGEIQG